MKLSASVCKCTYRHVFVCAHVYIHAYKLVNHRTVFIYILCSVFLLAKTVWERAQNMNKNVLLLVLHSLKKKKKITKVFLPNLFCFHFILHLSSEKMTTTVMVCTVNV